MKKKIRGRITDPEPVMARPLRLSHETIRTLSYCDLSQVAGANCDTTSVTTERRTNTCIR
jgi:hypothetical protein